MKAGLFLLAFFAISLMTNCSSNDELANELEFESTGFIAGSDKGMCPCCGGWIIKIDGDENSYRFEQIPDDSGIDLSETVLPVKFNWTFDRECNSINYIIIDDIELN